MDQLYLKSLELFMKYGIKSISMDEVSKQLGVSKKTLYLNVESKEDLVCKAMRYFLDMEIKTCESILESEGNAIDHLMAIGEYAKSHLRMLNPATVYDLKKYYSKGWQMLEEHKFNFIYQEISEIMTKGIEEGLFRDDLNVSVIAKLYISKMDDIIDAELIPITVMRRDEVYAEFLKYHIFGISSEKGSAYFIQLLKKMSDEK